MKQKYLAVALSAVFAATALAGCGSDGDSSYNAPTPTPTPTPTPGNGGPDNPGDAANPGQQSKSPSVVGQQYIRGTTSNFDKTDATNGVPGNNANSTVVGFVPLQNELMTNIVVAQFPDSSTTNANGVAGDVKYILGEIPSASPSVNNNDSLQKNNDTGKAGNGALVNVMKTQAGNTVASYKTTNQESLVGVQGTAAVGTTPATGNIQSGSTSTTAGDNNVRIFGNLSKTDATSTSNPTPNSAQYLVKNGDGVAVPLTRNTTGTAGINGSTGQFKNTNLTLNNVQYGRVTGALSGLSAADIKGRTYIQANLADKNFNGNTTQTDVYFYRGVGETSLANMTKLNNTGVYQYAGHALMYGIDNSFNGEQGSGQSNSVAFGGNGEGIGNFVQAQYDSGTKKVAGSVYNIFDKSTNSTALEQVDLVTFAGDVVGNSVVNGSADRTYIAGNDKAAFKGSFFGTAAQELGGSFNSITTEYGKSNWGGVFGAKQLPRTPVVVPPVFVPPINGVE